MGYVLSGKLSGANRGVSEQVNSITCEPGWLFHVSQRATHSDRAVFIHRFGNASVPALHFFLRSAVLHGISEGGVATAHCPCAVVTGQAHTGALSFQGRRHAAPAFSDRRNFAPLFRHCRLSFHDLRCG